MIRKYKGKPLTVPLAASVIAFGLALSAGCDEKTTTSTSSATHTVAPKGTVSGHVQDTNGNPVAGATVNLAGQTKTTDASGQYVFTNVPVTDVAGTDAGGTGGSQLVIVINPPATSGYLGSTVTVNPLAAIEGQNDGNNGQTTTGTHLVSGFSVQAGTAVLPKMGSSVSGVLRDNQTNLPVANTVVTLDLTAVQTANASGGPGGNDSAIGSTIRAPLMQVTTGADGSFSFPSVPSDSVMRISAVGYTINSVQTPGNGGGGADRFGTNDEDRQQVVGDVMATKTISADTVAPVIQNVVGALLASNGQRVAPALAAGASSNYGDGVHVLSNLTNTSAETPFEITLQLSEPVSYIPGGETIDSESVVVHNITAANRRLVSVATLSADGKALTITLTGENKPGPGEQLRITLSRQDFKDQVGANPSNRNALGFNTTTDDSALPDTIDNKTGKAVADGIEDVLGYPSGTSNEYTQILVRTRSNTQIAGGPVVTQVGGLHSNATLSGLGIGADVNSPAGVQQLNNQDGAGVAAQADAVTRINALLSAASVTAALNLEGFTAGPPVVGSNGGVNTAGLSFPPVPGAVAYNIYVTNANGQPLISLAPSYIFPAVAAPAVTSGTTTNGLGYRLAISNPASLGSGNIQIALPNVAAGNRVVITAEDSLGGEIPGAPVTLADNVAPIPVLQNTFVVTGRNLSSANVLTQGTSGAAAGGMYLPGSSGGALGPVLPVTPGMLATVPATGLQPAGFDAMNAANFGFGSFADPTSAPGATNILLVQQGVPAPGSAATYPNTYTAPVAPNCATNAPPAAPASCSVSAPGGQFYSMTNLTGTGTSVTTWLSQGRSVGIAFSEDIQLAGTGGPVLAGVATGWQVQNDIVSDITGVAISSGLDLLTATMNVNDLQRLAWTNETRALDFSGMVQDLVGNSAKGTLYIEDALPPIVIDATLTETTAGSARDMTVAANVRLQLTFNEPIAPITALTGKTIRIVDNATVTSVPLSFGIGGNATRSTDGTQLTVDLVGPTNPFTASVVAPTSNGVTSTGSVTAPISFVAYYGIDYSSIPDNVQRGSGYVNTWANVVPSYNATTGAWDTTRRVPHALTPFMP